MTKAKTILIGAVLAASVATPTIIQQHQINTRLNGQIEALRNQLAAAPQNQVPDGAATDASELEQLRRENDELLHLRAEVTTLRQRVASMPNKPNESNDRIKAFKQASDNEAAEAKALLAKSPEIAMSTSHQWSNVGFATPAGALETLNWAIANRDTNAFGNALIWDSQAKARADALFAAAPESVRQKYASVDGVIYDWWLNNSTPIAAGRVLSQVEEGANEVTLLEQHMYTDGRVRENTVQFQRDENGAWRQVVPPELIPKLEAVLNNLAGAQSVAGK